MPTSEARIAANHLNARKSTGPKTPEGKDISRANSYRHGLTGKGVIMPAEQAAEVDRIAGSVVAEMKIPGEAGRLVARQFAVMSVRLDRCFKQQNAAMDTRVRQAMADFEPPEGADEETEAWLRDEAGNKAMFDDSAESIRARRYEAAAERHFFRAYKELRQIIREAEAAEAAEAVPKGPSIDDHLASISRLQKEAAKLDPIPPRPAPIPSLMPAASLVPGDFDPFTGRIDVPISIGRRR